LTNQEKLLCLEYNRSSVHVREINWNTQSMLGLSHRFNLSYEGFTAFSRPCLIGDRSKLGFMGIHGQFIERVFLCSLFSNGSLLIFAESLPAHSNIPKREVMIDSIFQASIKSPRQDYLKKRRAMSDSALSMNNINLFRQVDKKVAKCSSEYSAGLQPTFPLTIFENLINVSERDEIEFRSYGIRIENPEDIKRKLSITSGEFIESIGNEGYTINVQLKSNANNVSEKKQSTIRTDPKSRPVLSTQNINTDKSLKSKMAIVAMRILLGQTSKDLLPREVIVFGRSIKIFKNTKRWYDIPLTEEEIMIGVRSGCVSIVIGAPFETGNRSIVDAVEVYALDRSKLSHLFLGQEKRVQTSNRQNDYVSLKSNLVDESNRQGLILSMLTLTHFCQICKGKVPKPLSLNRDTFRLLIKATALEGKSEIHNHIINLLKAIESNDSLRQMFLDKGTLLGASEVVHRIRKCSVDPASDKININLQPNHEITRSQGENVNRGHEKCLLTLNACLKVSLSIMECRPENYLKSLNNLVLEGSMTTLITDDAEFILSSIAPQTRYFSQVASNYVKLTLLEMPIINQLANLQHINISSKTNQIMKILKGHEPNVVKSCCFVIRQILQDDSKLYFIKKTHSNSYLNPTPGIAYQCDICEKFPITETRYTLEESQDIDLCTKCYKSGYTYARENSYSNQALVINGKKLRLAENKEMSCALIKQMHPVEIEKLSVEQVCNTAEPTTMPPCAEVVDEDEAALKVALKLSLENQSELNHSKEQTCSLQAIQMNVFDGLLEYVAATLSVNLVSEIHHLVHVLNLLLWMVMKETLKEVRVRLGRKICHTLFDKLRLLSKICIDNTSCKESSTRQRAALILCIHTLFCMVKCKDLSYSKEDEIIGEEKDRKESDSAISTRDKYKDKTDPRFVCDIHGVPAVRRRCSHGEHKDRRFYVCGLERKHRCKYFRWADDHGRMESPKYVHKSGNNTLLQGKSDLLRLSLQKSETQLSNDVNSDLLFEVRSLFKKGNKPELHIQLCKLIETFLRTNNMNEKVLEDNPSKNQDRWDHHLNLIFSQNSNDCLKSETLFSDGIEKSHFRLGSVYHPWEREFDCKVHSSRNSIYVESSESAVVQASLDLLSLVVLDSLDYPQWECWFAPLCEIISTEAPQYLRSQAKIMLKRLCGGRRAIYHKVRDHYVFGFHFSKLIHYCEATLVAALDVRNKARRCGSSWRNSDFTWKTLSPGGLIGVEDLISEDCMSAQVHDLVCKVLNDLIEITKSRGQNWRKFCALCHLPTGVASTNSVDHFVNKARLEGLKDVSPICLLSWIACSTSGLIQMKCFELINVALSPEVKPKQSLKKNDISMSTLADDSFGVLSTDVGSDLEGYAANHPKCIFLSDSDSPEKIMLGSPRGMSTDELFSFSVKFILNGRMSELRTTTSQICQSLICSLPSEKIPDLVHHLTLLLIRQIGCLGKESVEFLKFLQGLVKSDRINETVDFSHIFKVVATCFVSQTSTIRDFRLSLLESERRVFDIKDKKWPMNYGNSVSSCVRCHRDATKCKREKKKTNIYSKEPAKRKRDSCSNDIHLSSKRNQEGSRDHLLPKYVPWALDQMRDFSRSRLDLVCSSITNTEFANYFELKDRIAINEFYVSISDPRGRFVKSIAILFNSRPVHDITHLKEEGFSHLWQRCGTFTLTRGASKVSFMLETPIVASYLKFEFLEFHEKGGGFQSSEGSALLHCPRCTRVVNNAHGVCGHCGEVAFQCRKCRHINYDRLDAFFCVECGYSASGTFTYEINGGIATRAVAIVDDDGMENAIKMLQISNRKLRQNRGDLKIIMKDASKNMKGKTQCTGDFDNTDEFINYPQPLKRALLGEFPISNDKVIDESSGETENSGKRSSVYLQSSSQKDASSRTNNSNKAKSFLSLARQLRGSSVLRDEGSSRGDTLVRQALANATSGSSGNYNFEIFDESENDMLGLINASSDSNIMPFEMPDPLSRLVANIQARVRNSTTSSISTRKRTGGDSQQLLNRVDIERQDGELARDDQSLMQVSKESEELIQQIRENERNCYELNRRIDAWKRLNRDGLANDIGSIPSSDDTFVPSFCSSCSHIIAYHLISLAIILFRCNVKDSEKSLNTMFISCLFQDDIGMSQKLLDLRKMFIIAIVVKSKVGAKLVLKELQARLRVTRDVNCAQILGKLLEKDFHMSNDYADLAIEILNEDFLS